MRSREAWRHGLAGFLIAFSGCGGKGTGAVDTSHPAFSLPATSYAVLLWRGRQSPATLARLAGFPIPRACAGHDGALGHSRNGAVLVCDLGTPAAAKAAVREAATSGEWRAQAEGSTLRATRRSPTAGKDRLRQRRWFARSVAEVADSHASIELHFDLRRFRDQLQTETLVRIAPGLTSVLGCALALHVNDDGRIVRADASLHLARTPIGVIRALDSPTDAFTLASSVNPAQYWLQRFDAARYLEAVLAPKDIAGGIVAPAVESTIRTLRDDRFDLRGLVACVGAEWAATLTKSGHLAALGKIRDRDALQRVIGGLVRTVALFGIRVQSKRAGTGRLFEFDLHNNHLVAFLGRDRFGITAEEATQELIDLIEPKHRPAAPPSCKHTSPDNHLLGRAILDLPTFAARLRLHVPLNLLPTTPMQITFTRTATSIHLHACTKN